MSANQPVLRIKKNDVVVILSGKDKGKTGKVLSVSPAQRAVTIEGIGVVKRHIRPNQLNPQGGTKDVHLTTPVSKVALQHAAGKTTKIGYKVDKDGNKVRIAKANNKEIK